MTWLSVFLEQNPQWARWALAAAIVLGVAYVLGECAARGARAIFLGLTGEDAHVDFRSPIVRRPVRVIRLVVILGTAIFLMAPTLKIAGADITVGINPLTLANWLLGTGLRVVVIGLLAFVIVRLVLLGVRQLERQLSASHAPAAERAKRARTLSALVRNVVNVAVVGVATLMILRELGVDVAPILAGAGILGLAVGFGAQSLVRDVISGFFLILEDQIRVGDVAIIDGTAGMVEAINLRTTVLRDLAGVVHVFPNGSIGRLSNMTKDFSYAVLDVGVAYKEDTDRVAEVLREVGADLAHDPALASLVLDALEVLGVDAFGDSQVTIKTRIKTRPLQQWTVGRELRRRIKKAFDAKGIEIPFPHVSVHFGEASRPWRIERRAPIESPAPRQ